MTDERVPWVLEIHPSGQKMLRRRGRRGIYYFPAGPEQVTDSVCADLNTLEAEATSLRTQLEGLTPGGSEFVNNPERCVAFVRERLATTGRIAAERNDLQQQLDAAREQMRMLETLAGQYIRAHPCTDKDCPGFKRLNAALSASEGEGVKLKHRFVAQEHDAVLCNLCDLPYDEYNVHLRQGEGAETGGQS